MDAGFRNSHASNYGGFNIWLPWLPCAIAQGNGHSLPALASKKRAIAATDGLSSRQPWWVLVVVAALRRNALQGGERKGGYWVCVGVCVYMCVIEAKSPPSNIRTYERAGGRCRLTLPESKPGKHPPQSSWLWCQRKLYQQIRLQSLLFALWVMRAASHSCLSLFSFSLQLLQMVVSTTYFFYVKINPMSILSSHLIYPFY